MKVKGIPVGTPMLRPDWEQDNPLKSDYIKNKPNLNPLNDHVVNKANPHRVTAKQLGVSDYIIAQGKDDIWNWRKWSSGVAEIWGTVDPSKVNDYWIDLPIVIWAGYGNGLDLPYPVVTYSVCGVELGLFSQRFDPHEFEWSSEDDEEGNLIRVVKTMWRTPYITIYEEGDSFERLDLDYTIDVHMVGRWKPEGSDEDEPGDDFQESDVDLLYTHINDTENPHQVTAAQIGAVTQEKLKEALDSIVIPEGTDGKDGATFIPSVSENGIISWTNDGGLPNPEPVNIKGKDGVDGTNGVDGKDGYTPIKGVDYFDGEPGKDGADGNPGADGYTPIKGTDYWTETDKTEMVADVIAALPVYNGEVVE